MKKKIGLVLSGGGAYGCAHLGVLQVLEENNIEVDIITGTSMGALIGGAYAAGVTLKKMVDAFTRFKRNNFLDINPFLLSNPGLILGNKVTNLLREVVGNVNIEDCEKKFAYSLHTLTATSKILSSLKINMDKFIDETEESIKESNMPILTQGEQLFAELSAAYAKLN